MTEELEVKLDKATSLLVAANYVVGLTGAGVSVESGLSTYRGPGGLWTRYGEPPMDRYQRFLKDPKGWWEERRQPRSDERSKAMTKRLNAKPNPSHYALVELETLGILKALITQNTDNLHRRAGSKNLLEIHGNGTLMRCISCNARFHREKFEIKEIPPKCPNCGGIVKSDGVMFGEPIPTDVLERCQIEVARCDLMLIAGTSAVVYPTASFPMLARENGATLIEVNPYATTLSNVCDVVLQGPSGKILPFLVEKIKEKVH